MCCPPSFLWCSKIPDHHDNQLGCELHLMIVNHKTHPKNVIQLFHHLPLALIDLIFFEEVWSTVSLLLVFFVLNQLVDNIPSLITSIPALELHIPVDTVACNETGSRIFKPLTPSCKLRPFGWRWCDLLNHKVNLIRKKNCQHNNLGGGGRNERLAFFKMKFILLEFWLGGKKSTSLLLGSNWSLFLSGSYTTSSLSSSEHYSWLFSWSISSDSSSINASAGKNPRVLFFDLVSPVLEIARAASPEFRISTTLWQKQRMWFADRFKQMLECFWINLLASAAMVPLFAPESVVWPKM